MRSIRNIETPWAPYALMVSRDGTRIAMGGGCCYGHGGIILLGLDRWQPRPLDWNAVPWVDRERMVSLTSFPSSVPAVSSLCFSDDDRFLAVSMWGDSCPPAMLFEVHGTKLRPGPVFKHQGNPINRSGFGITTGVLLHERRIITRSHDGDPEGADVLSVAHVPAASDVRASNELQYLTHNRLVVVRDTAITEAGGSRGVLRRQADGSYAQIFATEGLALRDLRIPEKPLSVVQVEDCPRITAIAALPGNQGFVSGGSQGQIDRWSWDGAWRQQRLRASTTPQGPAPPPVRGNGESIVAIVSTGGTHDVVAVSRGGDLLVLKSENDWVCERLPEPGSPRSLAAHPVEPWIAVGIKQRGCGDPRGVVAILSIE